MEIQYIDEKKTEKLKSKPTSIACALLNTINLYHPLFPMHTSDTTFNRQVYCI